MTWGSSLGDIRGAFRAVLSTPGKSETDEIDDCLDAFKDFQEIFEALKAKRRRSLAKGDNRKGKKERRTTSKQEKALANSVFEEREIIKMHL